MGNRALPSSRRAPTRKQSGSVIIRPLDPCGSTAWGRAPALMSSKPDGAAQCRMFAVAKTVPRSGSSPSSPGTTRQERVLHPAVEAAWQLPESRPGRRSRLRFVVALALVIAHPRCKWRQQVQDRTLTRHCTTPPLRSPSMTSSKSAGFLKGKTLRRYSKE